MLLATISLSLSGWRSRLVTTSRRTNSRISASTSVSAGWSCSTPLSVLREALRRNEPLSSATSATKSARNGHSERPLVARRRTHLLRSPRSSIRTSTLLSAWPRDLALFAAAGHDRMSRYQREKCLTPRGLYAGETTLPTRSDQAVAL